MTPFVKAAAIRAVRTAAQTALATLGTGAVNIIHLDWSAVGALSGGAALVSILTSIVTDLPEVEGA